MSDDSTNVVDCAARTTEHSGIEYTISTNVRKKCPMCDNGYIPVEETIQLAPGTVVINQGYVECACGTANGEAS